MGKTNKTETVQKRFKRQLIVTVVFFSFLFLLLLFSRLFQAPLSTWQQKFIINLQNSLGVTEISDLGAVIFTKTGFYQLFGLIESFLPSFLVLTHFFINFYVLYDSSMLSLLMIGSLFFYFLNINFQLISQGPRPFWTNSQIGAVACSNSFSLPSNTVFIYSFVCLYSLFLVHKKRQSSHPATQTRKHFIYYSVTAVLVLLLATLIFFQILTGLVFLTDALESVFELLVVIYLASFFHQEYRDLIAKSFFIPDKAKINVFLWVLTVILVEILTLILYLGENQYQSITWVMNMLNCYVNQEQNSRNYFYNKVLGPWYTFDQSSVAFALIGAFFGIQQTYSKINYTLDLCTGTIKQKAIKFFICNVCLIPSWMIIYYVNPLMFIQNSSLNEYFLNSFHFLILYIALFGGLPMLFSRMGLYQKQKNLIKIQLNNNDQDQMEEKLIEEIEKE